MKETLEKQHQVEQKAWKLKKTILTTQLTARPTRSEQRRLEAELSQLTAENEAYEVKLEAEIATLQAQQSNLTKSKKELENEVNSLKDEVVSNQTIISNYKLKQKTTAEEIKTLHGELASIVQRLGLSKNATQADIFAKIASLMKRPNVEVVPSQAKKDQVISDYSERLATSENLRKEAVNSLTVIKQQVQTTQTNLAISVGLGSLIVCFLLIYLVLLKRKCSALAVPPIYFHIWIYRKSDKPLP